MLGLFGTCDVAVAGGGIAGVIAAIAAAREGAKTLLLEGGNFLGGIVTAGRLSKPTGLVDCGIFWEMLQRAAEQGGADTTTRQASWGPYTGLFDPEVMERVMLEMLETHGVEVLLRAQVTDVLVDRCVKGVEVTVKSGRKVVLAGATVDATGDGDVAALAGAPFEMGRPSDGMTQPITSYVRLINVDTPKLARYLRDNAADFSDLVLPETLGDSPEDFVLNFFATGFYRVVRQAKEDGQWWVPKDSVTVKGGMVPGEININATRFQGSGLDERTLSAAELALRKQAYNVLDFFRRYVPGCEKAVLLDIAPRMGVRETRRILGEYVLTADDVKSQRRFADSIALTCCPIDIHEPGGEGVVMIGVGKGYGIPYRCLLPKGVEGLLTAGRCISVDHVAFASTRNVPACALTGEAAGVAAALAARDGRSPRDLDVGRLQAALAARGIVLGN
jgi:glycine/D-amino acid oxidase-like deaminating enzyme